MLLSIVVESNWMKTDLEHKLQTEPKEKIYK